MDPFTESLLNTNWQPGMTRTAVEHLVEYLLTGILASNAPPETTELAERILRFDVRDTRAVILGGGTGLSTITGGNSQLPHWPTQSNVGLKQEFNILDFVVCTTDDGGSTGKLLQILPMIGIGDIRKLLLSSIKHDILGYKYRIRGKRLYSTISTIHRLFNYRFTDKASDFTCFAEPLSLVPPSMRAHCPGSLADMLRDLGTYVSPAGNGPTILPAHHALGNIYLASAIFMEANGRTDRPPTLKETQAGINRIADMIGSAKGHIHAATSTPGQLKFLYSNGVEVYGQSKSASAPRSSPVERITAEFTRHPVVSAATLSAIRKADLIIYAPGSLYTSIIPILQLEELVSAIRSNKKALKILGANSWVQEGETDRSLKNRHRGFLVSELIEAYDRNIRGGIRGLFDVVLSANMEQIPGNILRNYALEGKSPIHLDRSTVEAMHVFPVEATLFSPEDSSLTRLMHHDPRRFALAIRAIMFIDKILKGKKEYGLRSRIKCNKYPQTDQVTAKPPKIPLLCNYLKSIKMALDAKRVSPEALRKDLLEIVWNNRDLQPSHFRHFREIRVIPAGRWNRSTDLDNVLGYFDPKDQTIKLRRDLLKNPDRLQRDFLVALGESLLGRYIGKRRWIQRNGSRSYEIILESEAKRECLLTDIQLRTYLTLACMAQDPVDNKVFRITLNHDDGFLPPGLLFGLVYAWYLTGKGFTMEYEMNLLRWPLKSLIPMHAKEKIRKEALVSFFRKEIFGHDPQV